MTAWAPLREYDGMPPNSRVAYSSTWESGITSADEADVFQPILDAELPAGDPAPLRRALRPTSEWS